MGQLVGQLVVLVFLLYIYIALWHILKVILKCLPRVTEKMNPPGVPPLPMRFNRTSLLPCIRDDTGMDSGNVAVKRRRRGT